ncbi:hypothetical protein THOM_2106 [Trachipleistophora hominis]|uniref:Uncharacterized protein n=1 Tax=Trachipleistophora hominis TaxID=72359 RepID=L7JW20_TRAHO|nr:hypothetical protein THOM_2106 [Trachipleistophora hominis]
MLVNLEEMLRDKNIFVIITFFGLVISPSYADSFFRTCRQSISQCSDTNDEIMRHNNAVLCKKHLYLFGQHVESFSAIVLAFRKDFPYYFVQRSLKKQGFDGSDISKQSFIREIMCLLYLLYERVEQKIVEKVNCYNVLFSNTYDNTSTSMLYAELVKVYTNFMDAFVLFTPASSILQCEFELPRIMAVYFSVQLLSEFDLRPNNGLDAIFVKNIADYETSNGNKDIKAIEISANQQFFNVYQSKDHKKNIHVVLPVLLLYFDAVHLVLNDYLVNFESLLLLKNIIDNGNVTRLTASIFDLHRFSFYTFVKKIPKCKKTVLVLNLSGCFLGDSDLQAISDFNNLKRLVLPKRY